MFLRMLPYLWHSLWRSRGRTILTILGVAVAIFVFLALQAAIQAVTAPTREAGSDRLLNVREAARSNVMASRLPMGFEMRIEEIPGVQAATAVLSDLAVVGEEKVHIFVRGIDLSKYLLVHPIKVDREQWTLFNETPNAAVIGNRLMARMGWNVGDEVEIPQINLRTQIVGVIPRQKIDLENHMLVHRKYLQVTRKAEGQASYILVAPEPGRDLLDTAAGIDRAMAQSPVPTKTVSAAAYAEAIIRDFMGFIDYLKLVSWIVIGITMLGAANAIGISVRERTREIGVLKAIGVPPGMVRSLIVAESAFLALFGGVMGSLAAFFVIGGKGGNMAALHVSPETIVLGIGIAVLIGGLGGFLPASAAAKQSVVEALRTIE